MGGQGVGGGITEVRGELRGIVSGKGISKKLAAD